MLQVIGCIVVQHDLRLVVLAAIICLLASFTALSLLARSLGSLGSVGGSAAAWRGAAATAFGGGVWATHFVAMLAYLPDAGLTFDLGLTAVSLLVPVVGGWLAFFLLARNPAAFATRLPAGILLGASVGAMHFLGMAALRGSAIVTVSGDHVAAALAIGCTLATLAIVARGSLWGLGDTILLALAVCGLHFTGMAGVTVAPLAAPAASAGSLDPYPLANAITGVSVLILALSLTAAIYDRTRATRAGREAGRLRHLLDATFEGILFCRDGIIVEVNAPLCRLLGRDRAALIGRSAKYALGTDAGWQSLHGPIETEIRGADGQPRAVEFLRRQLDGDDAGLSVLAVRDVTERKRAERRIEFLAHHDGLTGLANRALFLDRLAQAVAHAERASRGVALLLIDLDGFKSVNDSLGLPAGDTLLGDAGRRLATCVREMDTVARLGGDEYAVLLPLVDQPQPALKLAERMVGLLAEPFAIGPDSVSVGASIGIALYPADAATPDDLLRAAGLALHRAKGDGKGTLRFFEQDMDSRLQDRRRMEQDLRLATARGELSLHYQPQFDTVTLAVHGYEALLRWQHPQRGWVSPAVFIPIAEESGLIGEIGHWVLETACAEAARWPRPYRIAVNLSPAQFKQRNLPDAILGILRRTGVAPSRLELEVTEGVLIDDAEHALAILLALKAHGMRIALDDFGTGYSSLSYLRRFPFDVLKIDKSFVQSLGKDGGADAIVRMVVALGHSLSLEVTAEGVETQEQLEHLRGQACGHVQGFLLGRPVPAADLRRQHADVSMADA